MVKAVRPASGGRSRFQRPKLEKSIEQKCREYVEALGGELLKMSVIGKPGFPDRTLFLPAMKFVMFRDVYIEFKRPGEEPTKLQDGWHKKLLGYSKEVWVIDNVEIFIDWVNRMRIDTSIR